MEYMTSQETKLLNAFDRLIVEGYLEKVEAFSARMKALALLKTLAEPQKKTYGEHRQKTKAPLINYVM